MTPPSGPSAAAPWASRPADPASPEASGTVLTVPDAADAGLTYFLPEHLRLAHDRDGLPVLSLTVLLDGAPDPGAADVAARVTGGAVALDVTLAGPAPAAVAPERELRPLFARSVAVELTRGERVLAHATGSGAGARVALSARLDRDDVLAVLAALDGQAQPLALRAVVGYRAAGARATVRLTGRWCDVHDALAATAGPVRDQAAPVTDDAARAGAARDHVAPGDAGAAPVTVTDDDLARAFAQLAARGALTLSHPEGGDAVLGSFVATARAVLLTPTGALGGRPSEAFTIDLARTTAVAGAASVALGAGLERTLGGVLDGRDRDAYISLVTLGAPPGKPHLDLTRVPRRVAGSGPRTRRPANGHLQLMVIDRDVLAAPARLQQTEALRAATPHALLALGAHQFDDHIIFPPETPATPMPVVDDEAGWAFPDRVTPATGWYLPAFELVRPAPSDDATTSPFTFSFARSGATADGEPGLDATVTLRLRPVRGPEADQALAARGATTAQPVVPAAVSVVLDLPFRDEAGVTRSQRFPARLETAGDVLVAAVDLIDDWARLCYGALSVPGFQTRPARVEVAWSYTGCVVVRPWELEVSAGAKTAVLDLAFLDAQLEVVRPADRVRRPLQALRPIEDGGTVIVARPEVVPTRPVWRGPAYAERTFLRSQAVDVTLPCAELGACYVERRPEGEVPIGCQDALRLGQTSWRQHQELPELADPAYRVFRSLQQPGRFVVLPAAYRLSRHPAADPERAYRPLILLYMLLDARDAGHNHVVVDARLEADLPPAKLAALRSRLRAYAADPVVVLPTDVECTAQFAWSVAIPGMTVSSALQPDGVAVTFTTELPDALLLRDQLTNTGVPGSVTFTFPDGSALGASLLVSLRELTGPYPGGPVELALTGGGATLTNRIERTVDVGQLLVADGGADLVAVPVERSLAPGASAESVLPAGAAAAWVDAAVPPGDAAALEEVRAFVEDITTSVVFLDLTDHAARGVAELSVRARLAGVPGEQPVALTGTPPKGTATFVLPLTTYLSNRVLQFQVTVAGTDGSVRTGSWIDWDLDGLGYLVSLTGSVIALPDLQEQP